MKIVLLLVPVLIMLFYGCSNYPHLEVAKKVDLELYAGKWYEIVRFPHSFEKNCYCVTAEYELTDKGYIKVINSCRKGSVSGKRKVAEGKAFVVENSNNAKLKVQFFWPFKGDYWIMDLAEDYSYVVVGHPSREYFWILSRTANMEEDKINSLLKFAESKGFDITKIIRTEQDCE